MPEVVRRMPRKKDLRIGSALTSRSVSESAFPRARGAVGSLRTVSAFDSALNRDPAFLYLSVPLFLEIVPSECDNNRLR